MQKKFFSFIALMVAFMMCVGSALAIENRASTTINSYNINLLAGKTSGEIRLSYDVRANKIADSLGLSSIEIYSSNGTLVETITGTSRNGLIQSDDFSHKGVYSYKGTSGTSYYMAVTLFAEIGDDYDSRVVTTSIVKAP